MSADSAAPGASALSADDLSEYLESARYGDLDDVRAFLDAGAPVNFCDEHRSTALHFACANGHADVAAELLARGAALSPNEAGNSALHWACLLGHLPVVEVLLARVVDGLDVYAQNAAGRSALTEALSGGHEVIARTLLAHSSAEPPKDAGLGDDADDGEDDDLAEAEGADDGGGGAAAGASAADVGMD